MPAPGSLLVHSVVLATCLVSSLAAAEPRQVVAQMTFVEVPAANGAVPEGRDGRVQTIVGDAAAIRRVLELIAGRDDAKTVSRPTIVTHVDREATIRIGGEFLVPVLQTDGKWTREPRAFGTKVDFVPKVVEKKLEIAISAKFSERDFENAVTINGEQIPGLTTSRFALNGTVSPGEAMLMISKGDVTRVLFVHPELVDARPQ